MGSQANWTSTGKTASNCCARSPSQGEHIFCPWPGFLRRVWKSRTSARMSPWFVCLLNDVDCRRVCSNQGAQKIASKIVGRAFAGINHIGPEGCIGRLVLAFVTRSPTQSNPCLADMESYELAIPPQPSAQHLHQIPILPYPRLPLHALGGVREYSCQGLNQWLSWSVNVFAFVAFASVYQLSSETKSACLNSGMS